VNIEQMRQKAAAKAAEQANGDLPPLWKPEPGDELCGEVTHRKDRASKFTDDDGNPRKYTDLTIRCEDGGEVTVRSGRTVLDRLIAAENPRPGDEIFVAFKGRVEGETQSYFDYAMNVEHAADAPGAVNPFDHGDEEAS